MELTTSSAGTRDRQRFFNAMQAVAVGAKLARRSVEWTVAKCIHRATSVELTLRHGRRSIVLNVMVSRTGPDLYEVGLRPVACAPSQRELPGIAA